jgi:excisionase family DNA binding protein
VSALLATLTRIAEALEAKADPDESLTTEQAARFLKVSDSTLLRFLKTEHLTFYEIKDHGYRFTRRDLMEFRNQFKIIARKDTACRVPTRKVA